MNFRTESFDFPQNEQRRCLSCDITNLYRERGEAAAGSAGVATYGVLENKDRHITRSSNTIRRPILVNVFTSYPSARRGCRGDDAFRDNFAAVCDHVVNNSVIF